jgi:predicted amidohydrolase
MNIALIRAVFPTPADTELRELLLQARERGADLAVLPELPLNPRSAATRVARDEDAEPPNGPRHLRLAALARELELAILGGAIVRDPETGRRFNTGLAFAASGELCGTHRKVHLPEEPGFWETSHYEPGDLAPRTFRLAADGLTFGIQICSDINRPDGIQLLTAAGAHAVLAPRATEAATWERWRLALTANALMNAVYVLSANRPGPEGAGIGGPSFAVGPDGDVLLESEEPVALVTLDAARVRAARKAYPGYLPHPAALYAAGWQALT